MLRAGLIPLWRDRDTVQIGVDPRRAVAVSGMGQSAAVIGLIDGSRDRDQIIAEASAAGVPAGVAERVLTVLSAAGVLTDYPAETLGAVPAELRRQLLPVLATASLAAQDSDGGARLLARRSATAVEVRGAGPVASAIIRLLTESGLAAWSQQPGAQTRQPDVIVLVGRQSPADATGLLRAQRPHLAVYASEAIGVVGPLVLPGSSACLRCLDLTRAERDPAWPLILAQLASRGDERAACDPVLAAAVAAQAAAQLVAFADGAPLAQATVSATLELVLPAWQWRRRTWQPHPACICRSHDRMQRNRSGAGPESAAAR